jgi:hypothetical protein
VPSDLARASMRQSATINSVSGRVMTVTWDAKLGRKDKILKILNT